MILDLIAGDLWTCGVQNVSIFTLLNSEPPFPIASPGFFASMITVLRCGSKIICVSSASCGIICLIFASVSSCFIRSFLSARSSTLFLIVFTTSLICESPFLKNAVSVVYTTMFAPSKIVEPTTPLGSCPSIVCKMSAILLIVFCVNFFHSLFGNMFDAVFCYFENVDSVAGCRVSF